MVTAAPASSSLALISLGLLLVHALLDRLRGALDQLLGLLQAQARDLTDNLDDGDLVVAEALEHDVELGLLLGGSATLGRSGGGHGHGGGGGNAKGLLDVLHQFGRLEQGHLLEGLNDLFASNSHVSSFQSGRISSDRYVSAFG